MSSTKAKIDDVLDKFLDINGKEGVVVVSFDGKVIASKFYGESSPDKIEELIKDSATMADDMVLSGGFGDFDQILIEGINKKIIIHRNNNNANFFIALTGSEILNVGLARFAIERAMHELEKVFKDNNEG